ncbi:MAG: isoquinoline 1-oxidoreductase subunit beta [Mycobacterium sp.]|nr:isoquinoline 1-oxidoreductase subunit beta [Mycobacterium sp.]
MKLNVNGVEVEVDDRFANTPLLWVLRDVLGLRGTKFGCGAGLCAACTVLIDGRNVKSCQTTPRRAVDKTITTVEGVSGPVVDAVRDAWYRGNVVQCGYCQPAQTLTAISLLGSNPAPDDDAIDAAMSGNICRCGTYPRIRAAIVEAAKTLAADTRPAALCAGPEPDPLPSDDGDCLADPVRAYLRINEDGTVVVVSTQTELGQGIHTTLATIVADELDAELSSIHVVDATGNPGLYGNPMLGNIAQVTGDSNSVQGFWIRYRQIAAITRARLLMAAAESWQVPVEEIEIQSGELRHRSGKRATFGELATRAERAPIPSDVRPKDPAAYRLIGRQDVLRVDSPAKILGTARYTIDVSVPGMLTAIVLHPPRFGSRIAAIDDQAARQIPGVIAVVAISEGVAVVGETFDDAQRGVRALAVSWDDTHAERRSSQELIAEHRRILESGERAVIARDEGEADATLVRAEHVIDVTYELPYLAQAPMEPNNAACRMRDDGVLEVWAGSQAPDFTTAIAAASAGVEQDQVEVHLTFAGGGFGLRTTTSGDPVAQAVEIAKALHWKHPIKVQSPRHEEFKSGLYRPIAVHRVRAAIDTDGQITAYHQHVAAQPISVNPLIDAALRRNTPHHFSGIRDMPYTIPNLKVEVSDVNTGVPVLTYRSIGNSHNEFARESALDELAALAGRDPVDLRRALLADSPRTRRALEVAAERAGWGSPLPEGHARGVACSNGFASHSAQVIEVSLDDRSRVHIDRIVFAVDCGIAVSPDLVRSQIEGGILFGLSAAAWGEVTLGNGGDIVTLNFDRYQVVRMRTTPPIEVHLIESTKPPGGVGEVSTPSVAPALANAIAALTGTRIRRLPLAKTIGFQWGKENTSDITITASEDGPYLVSGEVRLTDHDGREIDQPYELHLCRCGLSGNKPFCDGTHWTIDFDGTLTT